MSDDGKTESSGALLLRAAVSMRARALAAPRGPWTMRDGWGPADDGLTRAVRIAGADEATVLESDGGELAAKKETFEHIASWRPEAALAAGDLLESLARFARDYPGLAQVKHDAIDLARAYLGEARDG
jgi:hypothetical protein